jgi:hypothetical protein
VLLYILRQGYSTTQQSHAAYILRRDIRKAHVDVRFNTRVAADCWAIIDAIEDSEVYIDQPLPSSARVTLPTNNSTRVNGKRKSLDSQSVPMQATTLRKSKRNKA